MTAKHVAGWEEMQTDESRMVEQKIREAGFARVDAYRYNSASLRVRIIDQRFESIGRDERDRIVEPFLEQLPASTQSDIVNLVLLAPSEYEHPETSHREFMQNFEFENPSQSML